MKLLLLISFACLLWAHVTEGRYFRFKGKNIAAMSKIQPNRQIPNPPFPEQVSGEVYLLQKPRQIIMLRIVLRGLNPNSVHGFHIHEYGTIDGANGCGGAGGHYNPFRRQHGNRSDRNRHIGDLGNFQADKSGEVDVTITDKYVRLSGIISVLGRAFVFHQLKDDLGRGTGEAAAGSKTTGNAGARLACGTINVAEAAAIAAKFN